MLDNMQYIFWLVHEGWDTCRVLVLNVDWLYALQSSQTDPAAILHGKIARFRLLYDHEKVAPVAFRFYSILDFRWM